MENSQFLDKTQTPKLFDAIASTYDRLNQLLSFGIDRYWRLQMRRHLPPRQGLHVLDLATGTGDVALALIKAPQVKNITGLDPSRQMLLMGQKKVSQKQLSHKIQLEEGDGVVIPKSSDSFDVVTISFGIRNFPDVLKSLKDCLRVLKPGGRLMVLEFSLPTLTPVKMVYLAYFRFILPLVGNLVSGHKNAYSYLNRSVEHFPYGEEFMQLMRDSGFDQVRARPMTLGIATLYLGEKTPLKKG